MSKKLKIVQSIIALFCVVIIQISIALLFFHPYCSQWGATENEVNTVLPGDEYAEEIISTRAILIAKSQEEVWEYLVALGADRNGFYSYTCLEYLFGCKIKEQTKTKKYDIKLGRLVPIQSSDFSGKYTIGFSVIDIVQGQSFVLKDWGTFYIKRNDQNASQLIIRTHGKTATNFIEKIWFPLFDMMHYVMEKRMLLGIKDLAETNRENYNTITDSIWLFSITLTVIIGLALVFIADKWYKIILPSFVLLISQFFILILNPTYYLGILLVGIVLLLLFIMYKKTTYKDKWRLTK